MTSPLLVPYPFFLPLQIWACFRLFETTAMFLHAGVVHFLFNMLGFLQVGAMVERDFGWWRVRLLLGFSLPCLLLLLRVVVAYACSCYCTVNYLSW